MVIEAVEKSESNTAPGVTIVDSVAFTTGICVAEIVELQFDDPKVTVIVVPEIVTAQLPEAVGF
jgi:hypothetical protein